MAHVVVNIERAAEWQAQTDTFLKARGIEVCGNDYTTTSVNPIRRLFAPATPSNPSPRPVFVAINCVSNSPSHRYREILVNEIYAGGGAQDFSANIRNWRSKIGAVQAAPTPILLSTPRFGSEGAFQFTMTGAANARYAIEASLDLENWQRIIGDLPGSTAGSVVSDPTLPLLPRQFYRAIQQP